MTPTAQSLLEQVLGLNHEDRVSIADAVVRSISGFKSADIEQSWLDEAARRAEAIDRGEETTVPWKEVRERLHAQIKDSGT